MPEADTKKVMFLDDQLDLVAIYIQELRRDGNHVIPVSSADEARQTVSTERVDIAILDANLLPSTEIKRIKEVQRLVGDEPYVLEEGEGFRVAEWIREHHPQTGVIILSSERTDPSDKISGLDHGADDYVIKGITPQELASRVRAVIRRLSPQPRTISLGEIDFYVDQGLLYNKARDHVVLTYAEKKLLIALSDRPVRAKSRLELYKAIFDADIPSSQDRSVDNLVSKIRKKVRDELGGKLPVETVYGGGYTLAV